MALLQLKMMAEEYQSICTKEKRNQQQKLL
jgi:hypothetical protein